MCLVKEYVVGIFMKHRHSVRKEQIRYDDVFNKTNASSPRTSPSSSTDTPYISQTS